MIKKAVKALGLSALLVMPAAANGPVSLDFEKGAYDVNFVMWEWSSKTMYIPIRVKVEGSVEAGSADLDVRAFGSHRYDVGGNYDPVNDRLWLYCDDGKELYLLHGRFDGEEAHLQGYTVGGEDDKKRRHFTATLTDVRSCKKEDCLELQLEIIAHEDEKQQERRLKLYER